MKKKQVDTVDKTLFFNYEAEAKRNEYPLSLVWARWGGLYRDFKPRDQVLSLLKYQQERGIWWKKI